VNTLANTLVNALVNTLVNSLPSTLVDASVNSPGDTLAKALVNEGSMTPSCKNKKAQKAFPLPEPLYQLQAGVVGIYISVVFFLFALGRPPPPYPGNRFVSCMRLRERNARWECI